MLAAGGAVIAVDLVKRGQAGVSKGFQVVDVEVQRGPFALGAVKGERIRSHGEAEGVNHLEAGVRLAGGGEPEAGAGVVEPVGGTAEPAGGDAGKPSGQPASAEVFARIAGVGGDVHASRAAGRRGGRRVVVVVGAGDDEQGDFVPAGERGDAGVGAAGGTVALGRGEARTDEKQARRH